MGVAAEGDRAYVAAGSELAVVDLSDPGRPVATGGLPIGGGHAIDVDAAGSRVAVVDDAYGVHLADVAGPAPLEVSAYAPLASASGLAMVDDRVFIAAMGQGLRVVGVADPASPRELAAVVTEDLVRGVAAVGSNVFFATHPRPDSRWVGSLYGLDASADDLEPGRPVSGTLGIASSVQGGRPSTPLLSWAYTSSTAARRCPACSAI
jgi:hypothetical protein